MDDKVKDSIGTVIGGVIAVGGLIAIISLFNLTFINVAEDRKKLKHKFLSATPIEASDDRYYLIIPRELRSNVKYEWLDKNRDWLYHSQDLDGSNVRLWLKKKVLEQKEDNPFE